MIKFENKSNGRFYYLYISTDLFANPILSVTRGGKNISVYRVVATGCAIEINNKILQITKKRLSRGYTLVQD